MAELVHFFPGLSPGDYWQLTGYELAALQSWRAQLLKAQQQAAYDERVRIVEEATNGR